VITQAGREVVGKATAELNSARFGLASLDSADLSRVFAVLRRLRLEAGDFIT